MEPYRDLYHALGIDPLPDSGHTPLQRAFLLAGVTSAALSQGYDKAKLGGQHPAIEDAWAVLGDRNQRRDYDKQLLSVATEDWLRNKYIYIYIYIYS